MVDGFNAAGLDYATFGNHEFELDRDSLVRRIAESEFTWLSANCVEAGGAPFPGVPAWDTVRLGDRLIEANRSRLADPDNPDLVFPGQVFDLPPVPVR